MRVLVRAVTGAGAGVLGVVATVVASMGLSTGSCRFAKPYETHSATCDGLAAYSFLLIPVVVLAGLAGTALLNVWLLKVLHQPRPWWVVAPGLGLVVVLMGVARGWGLAGALVVLPTAFAVAGVVTGFGRSDGEAGSESK